MYIDMPSPIDPHASNHDTPKIDTCKYTTASHSTSSTGYLHPAMYKEQYSMVSPGASLPQVIYEHSIEASYRGEVLTLVNSESP